MERDVQEVRMFVLEVLRDYIQDNMEDETFTEDVSTARMVLKSIRNKVMLNKSDANWLNELIEGRLRAEIHYALEHKNSLALAVDELSIYSDIWGLYCRPGTYSI